MRLRTQIAILLVVGLPALFTACSESDRLKSDRVTMVEDGDAEMSAAVAKARGTLPQFWQVFDQRPPGTRAFCLKVRISDKNGTEFFWASNIERRDGKMFGTIDNDPNIVACVKNGEQIVIPEADIADWLYMRNGKMVGNYTVRALFKKMSPEEVEEVKRMLADP
jgi:uncharacterized protein YegJ (DUF2314 family)